jgi:hypothetical protein
MKIIKLIKLHRKLRVEQEFYCNSVCKWSQKIPRKELISPDHKNLRAYNHAVKKIEKKLPSMYFILSDIFGGASSLRKLSLKKIELNEKEN